MTIDDPMAAERVFLRPVALEDEVEFTKLARESADEHEPWLFLPLTAADFAAYLSRFDRVAAFGFVVCLRSTRDMVGMVNISQIVRASYERALLGYGCFLEHMGRGYMTEALGVVLRYAFDELKLHRLEADIQPDNEASRALARKLGFRCEGYSPAYIKIAGEWRDHERWAIHNLA